jgi:hypothetical protein
MYRTDVPCVNSCVAKRCAVSLLIAVAGLLILTASAVGAAFGVVGTWGPPHPPTGQSPYFSYVSVAPTGDVYVADGNDIERYTRNGQFVSSWPTYANAGTHYVAGITGLAVSSSGEVFVAEYFQGAVVEFSASGQRLGALPIATMMLAAGPQDDIYVNDRVKPTVAPDGHTRVLGTLFGPWAVDMHETVYSVSFSNTPHGPAALLRVNAAGRMLPILALSHGAGLIALDQHANIWTNTISGSDLIKYDSQGRYLLTCHISSGDGYLAFGPQGDLYVAGSGQIVHLAQTTAPTTVCEVPHLVASLSTHTIIPASTPTGPGGATVTYTLSVPAIVTITLERTHQKPTPIVRIHSNAGTHHTRITGYVGHFRLPAGSYRATIQARDPSGNLSPQRHFPVIVR